MIDAKCDLKSEMDSLRGYLYSLLNSENMTNEKVLKTSQELDKIILRYIKQKKA